MSDTEAKTKENKPSQTANEMDMELKKLQLEAARLEVEEKKANVQDLRERLAERELARESRVQRFKTNGITMAQTAAVERAIQNRCNHKKGGEGADGILGGQGNDPQYAVIKHTFQNGDTWVRCLRCAKTWKPPIEEHFETKEAYVEALVEYQTALKFPTLNKPSGSIGVRYQDGVRRFREATANTNLR